MRLLILTQVIDTQHPILGFFHRWVAEFAKHCESVAVICLYEGSHDLPKNVRVLSLGKEGGVSRLKYLRRFFTYICRERKNYDAVFVHMNPIYVVLGSLLWQLWGKTIALWYVHGHDDVKLRMAVAFAHRVFTAVPTSFPFTTNKLVCAGHGVDTETFSEKEKTERAGRVLHLLHVGRISEKKHIMDVLDAARVLRQKDVHYTLSFIGEPGTPADELFYEESKAYIARNDLQESVVFRGSVANAMMPEMYRSADYTLHLSSTGGLDKVVIESWCVGTPAFTNQSGFAEYLGAHQKTFLLSCTDGKHVAEALIRHHNDPLGRKKEVEVTRSMRDSFDVRALILRLVDNIVKTMRA